MSFIASRIPLILAFETDDPFFSFKGLMADCLTLLGNGSIWAWGSNLNGRLCTFGQTSFKRTSSLQSGTHPQGAMHALTFCCKHCFPGWQCPAWQEIGLVRRWRQVDMSSDLTGGCAPLGRHFQAHLHNTVGQAAPRSYACLDILLQTMFS